MMTDTVMKLIELAAKRFQADMASLAPGDDFFKKLKINSFQALTLLSDLEREFDVEIPDYELTGITTFTALAGVIDKRR
jgi:acyl carrier protein